jgi:hypothetical protein
MNCIRSKAKRLLEENVGALVFNHVVREDFFFKNAEERGLSDTDLLLRGGEKKRKSRVGIR